MLKELVYNVYRIGEGEEVMGLDGKLKGDGRLGGGYEGKGES